VVWPDPELVRELGALHRALAGFRRRRGFGRAIAAPRFGMGKRGLAMDLGARAVSVRRPEGFWRSDETIELWDDCMSVPDRVVRVRRHRSISIRYLDEQGRPREWRRLPPDMSELLQHEIDHLDGVLMTARAAGAEAVRSISDHAALVEAARPAHRLSLAAIADAARTIDPVFLHTPQYECEPLSQELGCALTLKVETVNPVRSFKGRGADYFLARVTAAGDERPMVCASAGNFGQAMAYTCRKRGRHLVVYAGEHANPLKVERMRALGAELRLIGDDFDAAKAEAKRFAAETGARMVEDGRDPELSEGAGSVAVELLERDDVIDAVTVPLGNGALLSGIARWLKAASPSTDVVGVSSRGADAMERSWRTRRVVERPSVDTIADGIAVRVPIPEAVEDMRRTVDDVVLVADDVILQAMRLLYEQAGLLIEPAGAAGIAAILADVERYRGRRVATVLCGGNVTRVDAERWLVGMGQADAASRQARS
jgi:threonine dehydratase/peptide deformylase